MKSRSAAWNVRGTTGQPSFCLRKRETHEQRGILGAIRCRLPSTPRAFDPAAPDQKFALGGDPFAHLAPATEDRLVRHFRKSFAGLGGHGHEKAIRIVSEVGNKPPFLIA